MLIKRFIESETNTHTYIVYNHNGKAVIIDSVFSECNKYLGFIRNNRLELIYTLDTHLHADHITGAFELKKNTGCKIVMSEYSPASNVDLRIKDGERLNVDSFNIDCIYTPGHTIESCCYLINDRLFTGDTLLINGCGRTDFQNGSSQELYNSIFNKLLVLPDETLVYPGHDYNNRTVSTILEEKNNSPRLQVNNCADFVTIMNNLNLPNPKYIDVAVPANMTCGAEI